MNERVMAARRGVVSSGVPGGLGEEDDMLGGCSVYGLLCESARDTGSQGVGSRTTAASALSANEQLSQDRLHIWVYLVLHSQTPGV